MLVKSNHPTNHMMKYIISVLFICIGLPDRLYGPESMELIEAAANVLLMYLLALSYSDLSVEVTAYCFIFSLDRPHIGSN